MNGFYMHYANNHSEAIPLLGKTLHSCAGNSFIRCIIQHGIQQLRQKIHGQAVVGS